MDPRLFLDEPMGLKDELLTVPLDARFTYDADRNIFFINMEGVSVTTAAAEAEAIVAEIEKRLAAVGKKVPVVVNYDNFYLAPDLADTYTAAVRSLRRTLLRQRHPLHDQLLHAPQTRRPSHRARTCPAHLRKPPRSTGLADQHRQPNQCRENREQDMSVYRVTEVIGVSDQSWEAAARTAIETAAGTVRELRIAEVVRQDVTIENGQITGFRVRLALSFKYDG